MYQHGERLEDVIKHEERIGESVKDVEDPYAVLDLSGQCSDAALTVHAG